MLKPVRIYWKLQRLVCVLRFSPDWYWQDSSWSGYPTRVFQLFPKRQFLDWTKFKASADDKLDVAKLMTCIFDGVENIVGQGENAGYQHFLFFQQYFQKASFSGWLKVRIVR